MSNSFTDQSNGLPSLDVQGDFRRARRARRAARITRWFLRQQGADQPLTLPEASQTPATQVSNLSRRSSGDDRAGLSARLERLYDDLEALGGHPVGESVADVYNVLLRDMTNAFADREDELKPFRQVTRDTTGESVRLLVGQLRLIAGDEWP
jgi:hypothetical protein